MRTVVVILHSRGEDDFAKPLTDAIESFGYQVWHRGLTVVGESEIGELNARLAVDGPVVICGTTRASGSTWLRNVLQQLDAAEATSHRPRIFPVRLEQDAALEHAARRVKIAECHTDFRAGLEELKRSLFKYYPPVSTPPLRKLPVRASESAPENFDRWLTNEIEISAEALRFFRERLRPEIRETRLPDELDSMAFLTRANLLVDERLFAAGVLLFSDRPESVVESAYVQCVQYSGRDQAAVQEGRDFYGPLVSQLEGVMRFIESRIEKAEITEPGALAARFEYQFPMVCVRELLANAMCHRDYADGTRHTHVRLFQDRIEIVSPGRWGTRAVEEKTYALAELRSEPASRNERLASALRWIKLVETEGSGIPNALSDCREKGAKPPAATIADGVVKVTVFPRDHWDKAQFGRRGAAAGSRTSPAEPVAPKIAPSKLFAGRAQGPALLVGREVEMLGLDAAWSTATKKNIVTIVAWGGVGKTSLVAHWAATKLAQGEGSDIACYFDWSFYSQGTHPSGAPLGGERVMSSDLFVREALEFFGEHDLAASAASRSPFCHASAALAAQTRTLLILDGIEPLQEAQTGELRDEALRALLRGLAANNRGLCVITTRLHLPDLSTWRDTTAPEWQLQQLSSDAGAALLNKLGVYGTDEEKSALSIKVDGHALTLTLLGRYLKRFHRGDIRQVDRLDFERVNESEQGGHAFRVIAAYERWLAANGCETELAILRVLGLFDGPATPDCLAALSEPPITGLTDLLPLDDEQWNQAVNRLGELGLVKEIPWDPPPVLGYDEEEARLGRIGIELEAAKFFATPRTHTRISSSLDAHALLREFFAQRLKDRSPEIWQTGNSRLFEHLSKSVPYWPERLEGLRPLYQAMTHGCRAKRYQETAGLYLTRIQREPTSYSTKILGALATDLAAIASFFAVPWTRPVADLPKPIQARLLNEAAQHLRALGRLAEAREPMLTSIEMTLRDEEWHNAAAYLANLAEIGLTLGDVASAADEAVRSIDCADRSGNAFQQIVSHCVLADVLHQAGKAAESAPHFQKAEAIQRDLQPAYPVLSSVSGFTYCDLLLADAERATWRTFLHRRSPARNTEATPPARSDIPGLLESCRAVGRRATETLQWVTQQQWLSNIGLDHLTLGRAGLYRAILEQTDIGALSISLEKAVAVLRHAGTLDHLPRALLTRAWMRALQNDSKVVADLDEAQKIAERGPMRLHLADVHLHRARIFRDPTELKKAREIIERWSYRRRAGEMDDALALAADW